jgi:multidrug efflux pump subunit AcrA (membrane-fusion protein)
MTDDTSNPIDPTERRRVSRATKIVVALVLIGLALGAARTVISRMSSNRSLERTTIETSAMYVQVAKPKVAEIGPTLSLPGTLQGYVQSPIAARASGYLRKWYRDIGSRVE